MKTKNKNYAEYIDHYESSWKDVLDTVSDKIKIDTLGGDVPPVTVFDAEVLALYCHNNQDAARKRDIIENLGYSTGIVSGYGPDIIIVHKSNTN